MMRTTVTLDPDVAKLLERQMAVRQVSFKRAVNDALRVGLGAAPSVDFSFPSFDMGALRQDLTHATRLAASLEDEALTDNLTQGR